ncbi:NAD(P)-binding protein [Blastococcus saxobsidens]|uniref:NAD(P)-binding protein n=1 Tax=Blastococcus saxobsidens TaxID=138336 RepID=A0A6L9VYV8_9ACTN|nr:NAD(P)-binding protein [Blastococcus saxobsidens]
MTSTPTPASTLVQQTGLPVVVIGAGPVGLAAAAHLCDRGLTPLVLEAGEHVGAAMRAWGHIRTFTPWQYIVDPTAEKLLAPTGWTRPAGNVPPTGAEVVGGYLEPLADVLGEAVVRTGARVVAVTREGLDKSRTVGREQRPFLVRVQGRDGAVTDVRAAAVIDASGTWGQRNPLGASGLPAVGEAEAEGAGVLVGPLPDVLGADRARFAGRRTLVVGMGHSAANTLLGLAQLAREEAGTEIVWAIRGTDARRLFGGGGADELPDRGKLGTDLRSLVVSGAIEHHTGFSITGLELTGDSTVTVVGQTAGGEQRITGVHNVAAATGFRPDVAMLSEVRLDLDAGLDAPRQLAPLVDPGFHSCGTVPPHGHRELAHPEEPGFYVVGMKSYGRAPTFLITTGNEQVRSIAAHLSGDDAAADEVQLVLPETGVCSVSLPLTDDAATAGGSCCGTASAAEVPAQVDAAHAAWANGEARVGFATGVAGGRAAGTDGGLLPVTEVRGQASGSCCG